MNEFVRNQTFSLIGMLSEILGLEGSIAFYVGELFMFLLLVLISVLAYKLTVRLMRSAIIPVLQRSKNQFDDLLVKHHFFRDIAYLVPASILFYFLDDILISSPSIVKIVVSILEVVYVFILILVINSVLNTINDYYDRYDFAKDHPIRGVIQIIQIIVYVIGLIVVVGVVLEKDLSSLVMSLGALSAVMMLVFKDPILGFVGGLQLIFNKMLSIDDWITMPNFGADGTVMEINLTTVKVQNWDKTIVTIPTYSLISDSFQNWRGMSESGGRRIKRSVFIDVHSVRFCNEEMLERFKKIEVLNNYITTKESHINEQNVVSKTDSKVLANGRRQTNLGVFRAYLETYLSHRDDINMDMTFMVRQLQPNEKGIPLEVYIFTKTTEWGEYESIQADIFDHVLAVVPEFDLKLFQYSTSAVPVSN